MNDFKNAAFLDLARKGTTMRKFTFNFGFSTKPKSSTKIVTYENGILHWGTGSVHIRQIDRVVRGKGTAVLQKAKTGPENQCFALVTKARSFDFLARNKVERDLWVEGLRNELDSLRGRKERSRSVALSSKTPQKHMRRISAAPAVLREAKNDKIPALSPSLHPGNGAASSHRGRGRLREMAQGLSLHNRRGDPREWHCPECKFFSTKFSNRCPVCDTEIPKEMRILSSDGASNSYNHFHAFASKFPHSASDPAPQAPRRPPPKHAILGPKQWACPKCTLINEISNERCGVCDGPKPKPKPKPKPNPNPSPTITSQSRLEGFRNKLEDIERVLSRSQKCTTASDATLAFIQLIRHHKSLHLDLKAGSSVETDSTTSQGLRKTDMAKYDIKKALISLRTALQRVKSLLPDQQYPKNESPKNEFHISDKSSERKSKSISDAKQSKGDIARTIDLNSSLDAFESWVKGIWKRAISTQDHLSRILNEMKVGIKPGVTEGNVTELTLSLKTAIDGGFDAMRLVTRAVQMRIETLDKRFREVSDPKPCKGASKSKSKSESLGSEEVKSNSFNLGKLKVGPVNLTCGGKAVEVKSEPSVTGSNTTPNPSPSIKQARTPPPPSHKPPPPLPSQPVPRSKTRGSMPLRSKSSPPISALLGQGWDKGSKGVTEGKVGVGHRWDKGRKGTGGVGQGRPKEGKDDGVYVTVWDVKEFGSAIKVDDKLYVMSYKASNPEINCPFPGDNLISIDGKSVDGNVTWKSVLDKKPPFCLKFQRNSLPAPEFEDLDDAQRAAAFEMNKQEAKSRLTKADAALSRLQNRLNAHEESCSKRNPSPLHVPTPSSPTTSPPSPPNSNKKNKEIKIKKMSKSDKGSKPVKSANSSKAMHPVNSVKALNPANSSDSASTSHGREATRSSWTVSQAEEDNNNNHPVNTKKAENQLINTANSRLIGVPRSLGAASDLESLAGILESAARRMRNEAKSVSAERGQTDRERREAFQLFSEAKAVQKRVAATLAHAQKVVTMAYLEKSRVDDQVKDIMEALNITREREEAHAASQTRELQEKQKELDRRMLEVKSLSEDLEAARKAFGVKKCAYEQQVEIEKKKLQDRIKHLEITLGKVADENREMKGKEKDSIPPSFYCPITFEVMKDPVVTADGYSYERESISGWISKDHASGGKVVSPQTGLPLRNRRLIPNISLRSTIEEFFKERPSLKEKLS